MSLSQFPKTPRAYWWIWVVVLVLLVLAIAAAIHRGRLAPSTLAPADESSSPDPSASLGPPALAPAPALGPMDTDPTRGDLSDLPWIRPTAAPVDQDRGPL